MGQFMTFSRPDGGTTRGYLADAGPGRPALVLIQEWWGLNDHICGIADRLAQAGFTTLAPDLFQGRLASTADEASHLMDGLDFKDATMQDLAGALAWLSSRADKVGVMGFCMGGALTISAAVHLKGLAAACCFYGIPPLKVADPARIGIPFQGHFAAHDDWCTPAAVKDLQRRLHEQAEIYTYPAHHAFFNDKRPEVYEPDCAKLAWDRSVAFFTRHLMP